MTHNAAFCPECGREMTRVKVNSLIGRDGWRWYCPVCAPEPHPHTPMAPCCVQSSNPCDRMDGGVEGHATRMFATEHPARTGTRVKAYVAGFTAAWNLCHRKE